MVELPAEVKRINKVLKHKFGSNVSGNQIYRISFSDNEREIRFGEFNEFYGKVFLRTIKGSRLCKKYPHIHGKFILEKWKLVPVSSDLIDTNGTKYKYDYEVIYIFEDLEGNYLPPVINVALILCYLDINPEDKSKIKNMLEDIANKKEMQEWQDTYFSCSDLTPTLLALRLGEGITVPDNIK